VPFPGESIPITSGTAGGIPSGFVTYRGGSQTLSGTPWVLWSDEEPLLLTSGDDAVVSWVVEVLSGSGTVTAETTLHTSTTEGTATWTSAGTHPVSGLTTLVIPTTLTVDDILGSLIPGLRMTSSGSLTVEQVKLRVWPPGGALGGWSGPQEIGPLGPIQAPITLGGFTPDADVDSVAGGDLDERLEATLEDLQAQQDTATLDAHNGWVDDTNPFWTILGGSSWSAQADLDERSSPDAIGSGEAQAAVGYIHRIPGTANPFPSGVFGVDWIYPPNEVWWDDSPPLFPLDPGEGSYQWSAGRDIITVAFSTPGVEPVTGPWFVRMGIASDVDPIGTTFASVRGIDPVVMSHSHTIAPNEYHQLTVPELGVGQVVRVVLHHYYHEAPVAQGTYDYEDPDDPVFAKSVGGSVVTIEAGQYDGEATTFRLAYDWTPPPFRYWTPTAGALPKLRQYHRDDGRGVAPRRAYGGASRANTHRAYGYT
jgi:hypothetical protein